MLVSLSSNKSQFKKVTFKDGVNVVIADSDASSDKTDSRNGVGKSSLIKIIHFCMGANVTEGKELHRPELAGWTFFLELKALGQNIVLSRSIDDYGKVFIKSDKISDLPIQPVEDSGSYYYILENLNKLLGEIQFGLKNSFGKKYSPSFRMISSYIARRGVDAFSTPFKYFPQQSSWQLQVSQTFLLDLSYEITQEIALCKDEEKALKELKVSFENGVLDSLVGDIGNLEADKVQVDEKIERDEKQLKKFKVHPQYTEIEDEVNKLTASIHKLSNKNILSKNMLSSLKASTKIEDETVDVEIVQNIYKSSGAVFAAGAMNKLEDVINFHQQVILNRKEFLKDELKKIRLGLKQNTDDIKNMTARRAELLKILDEHQALNEMVNLQKRHTELVAKSKSLANRINDLKKIRNSEQEVKIKKDSITLKANKDYDDRQEHRKNLIRIFGENTKVLYGKAGKLIININSNGYKFDIEIERDDSAGVSKMEVFCYDMLVAELWSAKPVKPGYLIHDSTVFSDVDERQISSALKLASRKSNQFGFQYICCLNSDKVPTDISSEVDKNIVLRLSDYPESECLFGFRF